MNGAKRPANGGSVAMSGAILAGNRHRTIAAARERFAAGADTVRGVRPEILMSWYRCREEYEVDPGLERAPPQPRRVLTRSSATWYSPSSVAWPRRPRRRSRASTVSPPWPIPTDTSWHAGQPAHPSAGRGQTWHPGPPGRSGHAGPTAWELPWIATVPSWSGVPNTGAEAFTRGRAPALAVRDVVTDDPLAVLNVSCWKTALPDPVLPRLRQVAAATEAKLRQRANHCGSLLAAAFTDARLAPGTPLAVVDTAGHAALANSAAAVLIGTPADVPAYAPSQRWVPQLAALPQLARRATERAGKTLAGPDRRRSSRPSRHNRLVAARPVFAAAQVIGALLAFGSPDGEPALWAGSGEPLISSRRAQALPSRVIATREGRWVLLDPREIRFAEADHKNVWLTSDQGRLQAAVRGLDHLEQQLEDKGFLRVHRRSWSTLAGCGR